MGAVMKRLVPADLQLVKPENENRINRDFALDFDEVVPMFFANVLVVEDDSTTSSYIKAILKRSIERPLRVRSFASAEKAAEYIYSLGRFQLPGPDVAIIDYHLSGEADGLWLCKLVENRFPETQTVLVSSTPVSLLQFRMKELNISPIFLKKPLMAESLRKFVV